MDEFAYNRYGRQETGFENAIDHGMFGHWRNPEYQEMQQDYENYQREQAEESKYAIPNKNDELPF